VDPELTKSLRIIQNHIERTEIKLTDLMEEVVEIRRMMKNGKSY